MRWSIVITIVTLCHARAQEDLRVLAPESEPRKMLYRFELAQAQKHFDARRQLVAKLKTPEDVKTRQQLLKKKFLEALGGFPEKTPLNANVIGQIKGDGFRVEKVIYESRPHHHVTANLYLPEGKGPFPGVLMPCGHSANGKAAESYQRAAILMAKNGMAVLSYDPIGQGERSQLLDRLGKPAIPGSTSEHTMVGLGALLVGKSTATYRIWDGIRSLDYLESRPEIDAKRLGCTGNSGGGTLTAYLMALDDRIVCAAPSCYITSLERLFATIGPQDAEQNITGQVAFGMEHVDYITMRAPRPTLICTATQDFFDIQGSWTSFREASLIYGKLGYGERVAMFEFDDKHGFSRPRREAVARWMSRWLLRKDEPITEADFPVFKDADLQCTRSGQVLEDFGGKSVFHFNQADANSLAAERAKFLGLSSNEQRRSICRLIGLPVLPWPFSQPARISPAKLKHEGDLNRAGYYVYRVVFATEPGIRVSGLWFAPAKGGDRKKGLTIYLTDEGMATAAAPKGPLEKIVQSGQAVLALDLRGLGETAPAAPGKKPAFFGVDFKESFLGIHLNRPLLGQRVLDLLSVLAKMSEETEEFTVIARGVTGPVALHAAALELRIRRVVLEKSLVSWSSVAQTPIAYDQLSSVVPGVLKVYDLPELAGTLAPRALVVRQPLDAGGQPISQADLEKIYAPSRDAYAQQKTAKALVLEGSR